MRTSHFSLAGLGLILCGTGPLFAQDRRPSMDRPVVQRPTVERPMPQRPSVERPTIQRPGVDRPTVQRPTVERPIRPASHDIVAPRPMSRCMERPTPNY